MRGYYRHTKIIATVGPATESPEKLNKLILAGLDVMRLNMAHGTGEWVTVPGAAHSRRLGEVQRHVAVMMDVKGPEIRTGVVAEPIDLEGGDAVRAVHRPVRAPACAGVDVNYPGLPHDVEVGATVLLDSGLIRLEVVEKDDTLPPLPRHHARAGSVRGGTSTCRASMSTCRH